MKIKSIIFRSIPLAKPDNVLSHSKDRGIIRNVQMSHHAFNIMN